MRACVAGLLLLGLGHCPAAQAYDAELRWTVVAGSTGYNIYVRFGQQPYGHSLPVTGSTTVGGVVETIVRDLPMGPTARFAVSSNDASGVESERSNELAITYGQAARVVDSDGDGLTDAEEDINLNRRVDGGETDPADPDSDDDGWSDGDEVSAGTNPLDGGDVPLPVCGNGRRDPGEACDDGNSSNGDACLSDCRRARCGDGYLWRGKEQCDDGPLNGDGPDASCRSDCTRPVTCGDADADGLLTEADAHLITAAAVGIDGVCRHATCDIDGDGRISVTDAALLLTLVHGDAPVSLNCHLTVTVSLESASRLERLFFRVDYSATGSSFVGDAEAVQCRILAGVPVSGGFGNNVSVQRLWVNMIFGETLTGPADLIECDFDARAVPGGVLRPEDLPVEVTWVRGDGELPVRVRLRF